MARDSIIGGSLPPSYTAADRIGSKNAWEVSVNNGRVSMADLKSLVRTADKNDTYRANWQKYQYRLVERNGNEYLQLRRQGVWSRFKGYFKSAFANDAARRREERAGAAKLILDTFQRSGNRITYAHRGAAVNKLGDALKGQDPELQLNAGDAQRLAGRVDQALHQRDEVGQLYEILRAPEGVNVPFLGDRDGMVESGEVQSLVIQDQGPRITQQYDPEADRQSVPANPPQQQTVLQQNQPRSSLFQPQNNSLIEQNDSLLEPDEELHNQFLAQAYLNVESQHSSIDSAMTDGKSNDFIKNFILGQITGEHD